MSRNPLNDLRIDIPAVVRMEEGHLRGGFVMLDTADVESTGGDTRCSYNTSCANNTDCHNNTNCYDNNGCDHMNPKCVPTVNPNADC